MCAASRALYRASGYRQAEVNSKLVEKYQGNAVELAIEITIKEGPQTRVAWVRIEGNYTLPQEQLPEISTAEGQGFDESSLADDRDTILTKYFDNGFPNATVDVAYAPVPSSDNAAARRRHLYDPRRRAIFCQSTLSRWAAPHPPRSRPPRNASAAGAPAKPTRHAREPAPSLRFGLFKQVDTAIQNPDGTESRKNVLVTVQEADRYTFDYGVGFEFQTGQPSYGTNQPLGATGVSPMVSLGVSRINVGGRHQTITMKGNLGHLQQRALISYDIPNLLNLDNLRFTATALYDNTVDVSTFTSKRLEGTFQVPQVLYKIAGPRTDHFRLPFQLPPRRGQQH